MKKLSIFFGVLLSVLAGVETLRHSGFYFSPDTIPIIGMLFGATVFLVLLLSILDIVRGECTPRTQAMELAIISIFVLILLVAYINDNRSLSIVTEVSHYKFSGASLNASDLTAKCFRIDLWSEAKSHCIMDVLEFTYAKVDIDKSVCDSVTSDSKRYCLEKVYGAN
ncbi:MAG: hypothetical protein UY50_C0021G0023 [Parcubacteria group bacterium GW2011_GWA2_49_9]|nr:MAG: hypothetical protein UY50_C0021G0023 [Parcubacteria group bacterium GW2011_GWA2_49_9]